MIDCYNGNCSNGPTETNEKRNIMLKLIKLLKELTENELVDINTFTGKAIFLNQHGFYNVLYLGAHDCEGNPIHSLLNVNLSHVEIILADHNLNLETAQVKFNT